MKTLLIALGRAITAPFFGQSMIRYFGFLRRLLAAYAGILRDLLPGRRRLAGPATAPGSSWTE